MFINDLFDNKKIQEAANAAQQAAIAINMKKHHQKPKDMKEAEVDEMFGFMSPKKPSPTDYATKVSSAPKKLTKQDYDELMKQSERPKGTQVVYHNRDEYVKDMQRRNIKPATFEEDIAEDDLNEIKKGQKDSNGYTKCWPGKHAEGTKKSSVTGKQVRNCVPNEGVAEGHADQQRKIFKKNGKPVGEVGIDPEASLGNGNWYVKHYASGYDVVGFDNEEEAVAELKHCMKQGVAEVLDTPERQAAYREKAKASVPALNQQYSDARRKAGRDHTPGGEEGLRKHGDQAQLAKADAIKTKILKRREFQEDSHTPPGHDGDYLTAMEKAKKISTVIQKKEQNHPFDGKLVGEGSDPLAHIKKLSGL